jgi:hypothetical protein
MPICLETYKRTLSGMGTHITSKEMRRRRGEQAFLFPTAKRTSVKYIFIINLNVLKI